MTLEKLEHELTVCKLASIDDFDLSRPFYFIGRTDQELSLVCPTTQVPAHTTAREDGWRAFRISGVLDFSLVGILSNLTSLLAQAGIGIFAVSTYNTDYILVKKEHFDRALALLEAHGYQVV